MSRNHQNQNNFTFKNIIRTAAELAHADFAYLVLRKENKSVDVSASYGMEGMDLKLISPPLLAYGSKEQSIIINDAYQDKRLRSNKIVHVNTQVVLAVTAVNVLFKPSSDFKIQRYHEIRVGEFGSLVLLDKDPAELTERICNQLASITEIISRDLFLEKRLVDLRQKVIDEVSQDLVQKTEKLNAVLNNMAQGLALTNRRPYHKVKAGRDGGMQSSC